MVQGRLQGGVEGLEVGVVGNCATVSFLVRDLVLPDSG